MPPGTLRRLEGDRAGSLADLSSRFEDLQTVLRCCERLVTELGSDGEPDGLVVEALWTTALLSYARCFADGDGTGTALTTNDLPAGEQRQGVLDWHEVLVRLRDHYADPVVNPRERFSVGVAQDADGAASGIAITSARQPLVDDVTVRQTGAIAYALSTVVDERMTAEQGRLSAELRDAARAELDRLEPIEVVTPELQR